MQVVVSDVPQCGGCQYALEHGIATLAYPASSKTIVNGTQLGVTTEELIESLTQQYEVDYVLLAGYLKVTGPCSKANTPTMYMLWVLCNVEIYVHIAMNLLLCVLT